MQQDEWVTGNIKFRIDGEPIEMEMTVPAFPVKPHRMLPVFQQMANQFVDASVGAAESQGRKVSCKAGCGACCRQAVPIAEVEVYQIAELVESMPEPRRSVIKKRFADAVAHFREMKWFEKINEHLEVGGSLEEHEAMKKGLEIVMEYFHEGIPCPFLEDESCSIHPNRPVACREYLVTSPAENCKNPTAETIKTIGLLVKPSRTLNKIAKTGRMQNAGLLTLIRALELAEMFPEDFPEKTGERWMADFFANLSGSRVVERGELPRP
jgi:Fe-S-cluster containining protein